MSNLPHSRTCISSLHRPGSGLRGFSPAWAAEENQQQCRAEIAEKKFQLICFEGKRYIG